MICGVMCVCRTTFKFVPKLIHKKGREWEGYRFVVLCTGEERGIPFEPFDSYAL